jgi:hypothetical protein
MAHPAWGRSLTPVVIEFSFRRAAMARAVLDKPFSTHGSAAWRRLARAVVLLFLLAHQAGAGIVCICRHQGGSPAAQDAHCPVAAGLTHQPEIAGDEPDCCAEAGESAVGNGAETSYRFAGICCRLHAQPGVEAASVSPPVPLPDFAPAAPLLEETCAAQPLPPDRDHSPKHARPLYLIQSCYLI